MDLSQQVPTLETCKAMKKAGFEQDTLFCHVPKTTGSSMWIAPWHIETWADTRRNRRVPPSGAFVRYAVAAPLLSEILAELPNEHQDRYLILRPGQYVGYTEPGLPPIYVWVRHGGDAEAAALLWLQVHTVTAE